MEGPVTVLRPDLVLVDWGPMTLTLSVWDGGRPRPVLAVQAAREALASLAVLADFQGYLKRPAHLLDPDRPLPPVVRRALDGARVAPAELTPLAAVAGAVADQVADLAAALGADKVIVNNGGDVALRLTGTRRAVVGLRPPAAPGRPPLPLAGKLRLTAAHGVGGVATSGAGGRSLSPGVADMVTVWAATAAAADGAATYIAGRTTVASPAVETAPARELQADSDLGERLVTRHVGKLTREERLAALAAGQAAAQDLFTAGHIRGCFLLVQGEVAILDFGSEKWECGGKPPSPKKLHSIK
ncbi:MAG: UPF0280 family protein [Deltaproteobacteria bacterium]|nr:UPF0280 family protein [Deltaproteobacteria bacterium]